MAKKKYKYKRGSMVVGKKADGTPVRKYVYGKTVAEKNMKLAELRRRYARGLHLGDMTVNEWSERWTTTYLANAGKNQKTHYAAKLKHDILPVLGTMQMRDVRASHIIELLNRYKGGKYSTVAKIYQAVKKLFGDAVIEGIVERNPADNVELPPTTENKRRPLTIAERITVLRVAQKHIHSAYVLTLLYSGARRGECIALRRDDVDLDNRRLRIDESLTFEEGNRGIMSGTKATKLRKKSVDDESFGVRVVPIPDLLHTVLAVLCEGKDGSDLLFTKDDGSQATKSSVQWWWKSFKKQCHIESGADVYRNEVLTDTSSFDDDVSPHYLRHTYSTDLYAAGVDKFARQEFLGHSNKDITDDYTAMPMEAFLRNLDLFNIYLNGEVWGKNGVNENGDGQ